MISLGFHEAAEKSEKPLTIKQLLTARMEEAGATKMVCVGVIDFSNALTDHQWGEHGQVATG